MSASRLPSRARRQLVLLAALAAIVLLAGCIGPFESEPELPSGDEAAEAVSDVGTYNATLVYETELGNETVENRIDRTIRPATGERYQVAVTNGNRTITVSNGTATWFYEPDADEVTITSFDGNTTAGNQTRQVRQLFDSVDTAETDGVQVTPIFPLFPATQGSDGGSTTQTNFWADPVTVSYEGVETVADREAHVITMESTEDADQQMEQTLYFDTEYYVVLGGEWEMEVGEGENYEQIAGSMRVEEVDFDPDVDEDIFDFDPPENATVNEVGENVNAVESYNDVVAETDQPVPAPDVPADFEFDTGSVTEDAVSLTYENETTTLFVTRRTTGSVQNGTETLSRDGRTYYYSDRYGSSTVQWQCGDAIYSVGGQLDQDRLLQIAESVECVPPED